jgi:hypothetical protein
MNHMYQMSERRPRQLYDILYMSVGTVIRGLNCFNNANFSQQMARRVWSERHQGGRLRWRRKKGENDLINCPNSEGLVVVLANLTKRNISNIYNTVCAICVCTCTVQYSTKWEFRFLLDPIESQRNKLIFKKKSKFSQLFLLKRIFVSLKNFMNIRYKYLSHFQ